MKNIRILFITIILIIMVGCDKKEATSSRPISVYDTNQYQLYKQVFSLIVKSDRRNAHFIEEVDQGNTKYWKYGIDDIIVKVEVIDDLKAKYTILKKEEELHSFIIADQGNPIGITISYVDITKDGNNDIVVIGEPPGGTLPNPRWIYVYDIKNATKIDVFNDMGGLTEEQRTQLGGLLDEEFNKLFPKYNIANNTGGHPYTDEDGNLYYYTGIFGESDFEDLGGMIILFVYDSENGTFNVSDFLHIPNYVYNE